MRKVNWNALVSYFPGWCFSSPFLSAGCNQVCQSSSSRFYGGAWGTMQIWRRRRGNSTKKFETFEINLSNFLEKTRKLINSKSWKTFTFETQKFHIFFRLILKLNSTFLRFFFSCEFLTFRFRKFEDYLKNFWVFHSKFSDFWNSKICVFYKNSEVNLKIVSFFYTIFDLKLNKFTVLSRKFEIK